MLNNRQGQISIFIIISIIIVVVAAFVLYTSDIEIFYSPEDRVEGQIRESIDTCIDSSASSALIYLQTQGGVIDTSSYIRFRDDYLQLGSSNTSLKIPNWDVEDDRYPTLPSMQRELDNFMEEDIQGCVRLAVRSLEDAFEIDVKYEEISVETEINFETIDVETYLPIEYKQVNGEIESFINDFYVEKESKLGDLYALAIEIYNTGEREVLFEDLVLDQIFSASNYADRTTSMPSQGMEITCSPRIWLKSDLKETLGNLNNNNFRYLEFVGTAPIEYRFESNLGGRNEDLKAYFKNFYSFELENTRNSFEDYEVNVVNPAVETFFDGEYSRFSPYREFEVSPSNGEVVRSLEQGFDTGFGKFNFGCIQIYAHSYTLDYDLMIRLEDVSGESEDFFQFPIRVDIEQNNPKESNPTFIIPEEQQLTLNEASYCVEDTYQYPVEVLVVDESELNFEEQYMTNVNISFKCLGLTCDLGDTQRQFQLIGAGIENEFGAPVFEGKVPYCYGGKFIAEKEGYFQIEDDNVNFPGNFRELSDIDATSPFFTTLNMVPTRTFEFNRDSFEGRTWKSGIEGLGACYTIPEDNAEVYIQIENKELGFESSAFYSKGEDLGDLSNLELLVRDETPYNVTAYYMNNDEIIGLMEIENWIPDIEFASSLNLVIPVAASLEDDNFLEYYEGSKELYGELAHCTGVKSTPFGISLR